MKDEKTMYPYVPDWMPTGLTDSNDNGNLA